VKGFCVLLLRLSLCHYWAVSAAAVAAAAAAAAASTGACAELELVALLPPPPPSVASIAMRSARSDAAAAACTLSGWGQLAFASGYIARKESAIALKAGRFVGSLSQH
jgi:hypothetical protein